MGADVDAAREHPSDEVYVTGTFDNWSKSVKLDRDGTAHEKTVNLPESSEKILYKVSSSVRYVCWPDSAHASALSPSNSIVLSCYAAAC